MKKYYRQYDNCRQNEKPFCSNTCPFHLDVLDFQSMMVNANYSTRPLEFSYLNRSFRNKVPRCPACGQVYIPEKLAKGRMNEVEKNLEEK